MDLRLKLANIDKRQLFMLGITVSIAVIALSYQFYYEPSQRVIMVLRQEIATRDAELNTTLANSALIKKQEKEIPKLEEELGMLRLKTAASVEIIPLISTMEEEAQRLDLKVLNMVTNIQEPLPPVQSGASEAKAQVLGLPAEQASGYTKIFVDIGIQGKYRDLEEFIRTLQSIAPFLIIDEVNIRIEEDKYPELVSRLVIKAYSKEGDYLSAFTGER